MSRFRHILIALLVPVMWLMIGTPMSAQSWSNLFEFDRSEPITSLADSLTIGSRNNQAILEGNAVVIQGDLNLSADRIVVDYHQDTGRLLNVSAVGNIVLSDVRNRVTAQKAVYDFDSGLLTASGSVAIFQGTRSIKGDRLIIDLDDGSGRMEGNVTTEFLPQSSE